MGPGADAGHQRRTIELSNTGHPPIVGSPLLLTWKDEQDTLAFAQRLAARPEIADAFIELRGDLGAGKTTFVRHLLRALGVPGHIKSPTYAIVEPHEGVHPVTGARIAASHFDFYRFDDPREWEDAGFRDLFASSGLKLAEWPDKAAGLLPTADLRIGIELAGESARSVTVLAGTPRGREMLA